MLDCVRFGHTRPQRACLRGRVGPPVQLPDRLLGACREKEKAVDVYVNVDVDDSVCDSRVSF